MRIHPAIHHWLLLVAALGLASCGPRTPPPLPAIDAKLLHVELFDTSQATREQVPVGPSTRPGTIELAGARNEWISFTVQLAALPKSTDQLKFSLRLQPLQYQGENRTIPATVFAAYQVLPMPVDVNRAGWVRQTGQFVSDRRLPRALLPLALDNGLLNLSALRDPSRPTDPAGKAGGPNDEPVLLWIDMLVPIDATPGDYQASCDLKASDRSEAVASLPISLTVYDFVLSDERHLNMVSRVDWETLQRLWPNEFEAITPRNVNRQDPRYGAALKVIDGMVRMAQAHRTQVIFPRLQPTPKWTPGLEIHWDYFDSILTPWMKGEGFADRTPYGFWPLPTVDNFWAWPVKERLDYWAAAARHADAGEWLRRSAAVIETPAAGRLDLMKAREISREAASILDSHANIRVMVPLEEDQVQLKTPATPDLVDSQNGKRIVVAAPGLVSVPPVTVFPQDMRPGRWLRTDVPGLVPYVGAGGDERDVRLWAWLAYLRGANLILWNSALPVHGNAEQPADPNALIWFYPGSWFGVAEPVPTVQLKWLRRAQQDYEYLYLARERGERINALQMARLITKPVEIQVFENPDPTYGLLCGTTDQRSWTAVQKLLARTILVRKPGEPVDEGRQRALYRDTLGWSAPQERPTMMGRSVKWGHAPGGGKWLDVRLAVDLYNASDDRPDGSLWFSGIPDGSGWQVKPQPTVIDAMKTYNVHGTTMDAQFDVSSISKASREPIEMSFLNRSNNQTTTLKMRLPAAVSEQRVGGLALNGSLEDWDAADMIQDGPLVRMFDRPSLHQHLLKSATTPAKVYTSWAGENFYVAFSVQSSPAKGLQARNFVDYQFRRAWGEDLVELLIQPIYANNQLGPVLHIVCKPQAQHWVERKLDPRLNANPWQSVEGAEVRYAATVAEDTWRGEIAIPWKVILDKGQQPPRLLRFNFAQHLHRTGESASWAGPIDFGRDDDFMGLIELRVPDNPGMKR